jgi:hypothetical protein
MTLIAIELSVLSWSFLNATFETGFDALQYHRMADAIVAHGYAPWVLNPLSYIGLYPGGDSSGVPFLAASFSLAAGAPMALTVLAYDAVLLLVLGLGLFALTNRVTNRADLALLAVLMGSLAYGFFTTISWNLDERSFNVALTPLMLLLVIPGGGRLRIQTSGPRIAVLGLIFAVMFVSHLNFLILLPFVFVVPLLYEVVRHQRTARRKRHASLLYFGLIGLTPLVLLSILNQSGVLSSSGLDYQLESSALFSGSSPIIFMANAFVFLGTRIGLVNVLCLILGLLFLATRPHLRSGNITLGAFLLAGFLGLPIVVYSKDLLTPVCVLLGAVGLGSLLRQQSHKRALALAFSAVLIVGGSVAFNGWNTARTSRSANAIYWTMPGVTPEAQAGSLWTSFAGPADACVYGNNPALVQQVITGTGESMCTGLPVDFLINSAGSDHEGSVRLHVVFAGVSITSLSDWFTSPELTKVANDFARLPTLSFNAGRSLLLSYGVAYVVVDLEKPYQVPLFSYQGTVTSVFFTDLWNNLSPVYRTTSFAIFRLG